MSKSKIILVALLLILICGFFYLDLKHYLDLGFFKSQQAAIETYSRAHPWWTASLYVVIYVAITTLSLPGAALMTLAGGALFGLVWGGVLVSFASTVGATLAFLLSRFLLRDFVQTRFGENLVTVNDGIEKDGPFYLLTLRLVPAFPFFVVNLVMGLTPIKITPYVLVSWLGMLPGTLVYVNAGTEIARLDSLGGILSPSLIASFTMLGLFPIVAARAIDFWRARRVLRHYPRPRKFDRDLVVIGAGAAGLVTSYIAAVSKAKVSLVERNKMGGDCLNTGCVPSKALIRSAGFLHTARTAQRLGFRSVKVDYDFSDVMDRVRRVIRRIEPHDSVDRYRSLGVDCVEGTARIKSPYEVQVGERTLTTRSIVIAAGAEPFVPSIPGIENSGFLTSETLWDLSTLPERLIVLGGGPIGCELAQAFGRLGSSVSLVERLPRLLIREDTEVSEFIGDRLKQEGVDLRTGHDAKAFRGDGDDRFLVCSSNDREVEIPFDRVIVAVGRAARIRGYGLEELGISLTNAGTVEVNDYLQTRIPNIYACGDVVGPYQFTHVGAHQAWYAAVNALFGSLKRFRVDYSVIPWATFTSPEVARVGLNEIEAREKGIAYETTVYDLSELDRAIADESASGFVKVLTPPGKDRLLGATIVAEHAGELISEYVAAMRHGFGLKKILGTIHIYPTLSEANKYAAGEWRRARAPERLLKWVERYHAWQRR